MTRIVGLAVAAVAVLLALSAALWAAAPPVGGQRVLALGEEKTFGFFDPHLHVAVVDVAKTADGRTAVAVRARSDAARIDVDPTGLKVVAIDGHGNEHAAVAGELAGVLHPGEESTRTLVFDLPHDTARALLWVTYPNAIERMIPDHANEFMFRKVVFDLGG